MTLRAAGMAAAVLLSVGPPASAQPARSANPVLTGRYQHASGRLRVSLAQQPRTPNGRSIGPRTTATGGIQDLRAQIGASGRTAESALTAVEDTEYGGWKRLGMSLGHFADIVSRNERDGVFTVGMLWLDAHPDFNTPATTRSGSLRGLPVAVARRRPTTAPPRP